MATITLLCIGGCMDGKRINLIDRTEYFYAEHPCDLVFSDNQHLEDRVPVSIQQYIRKRFRYVLNGEIQEISVFMYEHHDKGIIESLIEGYRP